MEWIYLTGHLHVLDRPPERHLGIGSSIRLLRSKKTEYGKYLCELISQKVRERFEDFPDVILVNDLQESLVDLARRGKKRIVLLFDDAAHIGRETDLTAFFDLFRTLSNNSISCKAAIYPGVTNFGERFDVYNDANVIDITRNEHSPDFDSFFTRIIEKRYPNLSRVTWQIFLVSWEWRSWEMFVP